MPPLPPDVPTESAHPDLAARGDTRLRRRVVVHMGVEWSVVECDGAHVPGGRGPRCLIFASPEAIRRIWDVPPDWYTLSDAALFALSWRR